MRARLPETPYQPEKLAALIHYICERAPNPKELGATKLHKILFYSDMKAYLELGIPITGEVYIKHQFGPVASHLNDAVKELVENKTLVVRDDDLGYGAYEGRPLNQRLFFSLRSPG